MAFRQQLFVRLEPHQLDLKCRALACYESQQHRNYADPEYIRSIARARGIEGGCGLAECFEVSRWFL
jgi:hypothetical protein